MTGERPRAVLLDIDGTLVDSNEAHVTAWVEALREGGREVSPDLIRPLVGMGGDNILPAAVGLSKETHEGELISRGWEEAFKRLMPNLKPQPGAREMVKMMLNGGLRVVVATSSAPSLVQGLLDIAGVADLLPQRTSAGDVDASKPDPDIVLAALSEAEVPPGEAIMVGDTPYDVQAAARAGVRTVSLRCGGFSDEDLSGSIAIYDHPADLAAGFGQSVFSSGRSG
jgi:HAD superfamily hydrolase (TIGR01509 family)